MNPARTTIWIFGVLLVIAGLLMLYFETGLAAWIPGAIALAGFLVIVGLLVLSFANRAPADEYDRGGGGQSVHKEEHHH